MNWLSLWMFNPAMMLLGAAAIAAPIIIHLLNKRRFQIIDWAAMEFLFDADKKNRRRIRLENMILLALRCLAMLLLGMLLARPFLPSELAGRIGQVQEYQRVLLVDDSLSQHVMIGSRTAFEATKDRIKQLLQQIASDGNGDYLTVYVTSKPNSPIITNELVTSESLDSLIQRVDEIECSDQIAVYDQALTEIRNFVENDRSKKSPVVYVLTDLRRMDWQNPDLLGAESAPNKLVAKINETVDNTFVVDVGASQEENISITEIRANDLLVANTIVRFTVSVTNHGSSSAENVNVRFRVDQFQPQTESVASIAPGQTETLTFRYMFQSDAEEFDDADVQQRLLENRMNFRVQAEIVQDGKHKDGLVEDSEAFFAARALKGLPVLVVDGHPSPVPERSDAYYLKRIGLPGTGLLVDVATASQLETISLSKYKVIFLCNVDEASPDRIQSLKQWVNDGGGLVFMPGDQVRASIFNETFFEQGNGLSPIELLSIGGDAMKNDWVFMEISDPAHPALRVTQDEEVGMGKVEIFSWWNAKVKDEQDGSVVSTPLRLSNEDNSPAMAEKTIGNGRAVAFAFAADADWTMWPAHPTYIPVLWDLANFLVGKESGTELMRVGGSLTHLVDLSLYDLRVSLTDPIDEKIESTAQPIDKSEASEDSVLYQVNFENLGRRGFYALDLKRQNGQSEKVLYAANTDPREGDLTRLDVSSLPDEFFGKTTKQLTGEQLSLSNESRASNEIWPQILLLLAGLLIVEQFLGWFFGRKR